jgi:hypothetical protein
VPDAASYRFALIGRDGEALFDERTAETSWRLPADVTLRAGRLYGWRVDALTATGAERSAWAVFSVADDALRAEMQRVRPEHDAPMADRVLHALLLESHGLLQAAEDVWRRLAAEEPRFAGALEATRARSEP